MWWIGDLHCNAMEEIKRIGYQYDERFIVPENNNINMRQLRETHSVMIGLLFVIWKRLSLAKLWKVLEVSAGMLSIFRVNKATRSCKSQFIDSLRASTYCTDRKSTKFLIFCEVNELAIWALSFYRVSDSLKTDQGPSLTEKRRPPPIFPVTYRVKRRNVIFDQNVHNSRHELYTVIRHST